MSEKWITGCLNAIERINKLLSKENKDRLERLRSIKTSLVLMERSLSGLKKWVNNPATMSNFSEEELEDMEKNMSLIAKNFIRFDLESTKIGREKGLNKNSVRINRINFIV